MVSKLPDFHLGFAKKCVRYIDSDLVTAVLLLRYISDYFTEIIADDTIIGSNVVDTHVAIFKLFDPCPTFV